MISMVELTSLFFGFAPALLFAYLVYWVDRYEKEPVLLLGVTFTWGVVVAAGFAFLFNTLLGMGVYFLTESETTANLATSTIFAPIVEESLKGLAVLIIFLLFRREFDSVLDGIIYAAVVALGFTATENAWYIYNGYADGGVSGMLGLIFVRVVLVGWQHPFYTSFIGIGLAVARLSPRTPVKLLAPILGWFAAVLTHSFHNLIATLADGGVGYILGTVIDWTGWLAMLVFVFYMLYHERRNIQRYLSEEVDNGLISAIQYRTAGTIVGQLTARLGALFNGRYRQTTRFYQVCGELVHKKLQFEKLGDERGNQVIITQLRGELARLAPLADT